GKVTASGDATPHGQPDPAGLGPGETVTSLSPTPSGSGYWIFTNRGRAIPFGDAAFYGDMSRTHLNGPVLGSSRTPSAHGYLMVGADGGIFDFSSANFLGSLGANPPAHPIVSVAPRG